jgi:hypothetical protein
MKTFRILFLLSGLVFFGNVSLHARNVQIAIMLDVSGSMNGLIHQAQSQLWNIVNTVALANCSGQVPNIEIALYEYGNDGRPGAGSPFIKQISNFTTDLDLISEQLFQLATIGSAENCGAVIQDGIDQLQWNPDPQGIKIIFIAGNEPFTQGPVDYRNACANAVKKGVIVNTIYCGDCNQGVMEQWKDGADRGKGFYACINTNAKEVYIESPFDKEILQYNDSLNTTYINYVDKKIIEKKRESGYTMDEVIIQNSNKKSNQMAQDENAGSASPSAMISRTVSKSNSAVYRADDWDLVTNAINNQVDWNTIEKKSLPQAYQNYSIEELKAIVQQKIEDRQRFQQKIKELGENRDTFVLEAKKNMANSSENTLEKALLDGVKKQIEERGCSFAVN